MNRRVWIVFIGCQLIGIVSGISVELSDQGGAQFWYVSFVGLLPGNILAALLIERIFWNSGMTLKTMFLLELPIMAAMNSIVWLSFAFAFRTTKRVVGRRGTTHRQVE